MQEVNVQAVDPGAELRMGVQASLEAAPVVSGAPIPDQLLHPVEGDALPPIIGGLALRPAPGLQAAARGADPSTRHHHSEGRDRPPGARQFRRARLWWRVASKPPGPPGQSAPRDPNDKMPP